MKKQRRRFIKDTALLAGASLIPLHYSFNNESFKYIKAPFEDLDTLCVNDWWKIKDNPCLLYTSPSPRDGLLSRMPSSA